MKCLMCGDIELEKTEITKGLYVHHCKSCGGNWMRFDDYLNWRNNYTLESEEGLNASYLQVEDSTKAKLCPDCSYILTSYNISKDLRFRLDQCGTCHGVWFDKNEWETLKLNKLHNKIHNFFTDFWQNRLHEEERREQFDKHYLKKFGQADYEKIKEVKKWLDTNQSKDALLAFLINRDPYKL